MSKKYPGIARLYARVSCAAVAALAGLAFSVGAHAALGASPLTGADARVKATSLASARALVSTNAAVSGSSTSVAAQNASASLYNVNTVTLETGTVIREFVAVSNNQVFAVVWQGPRLPDMRVILGTYFSRFANAQPGDAGVTGGVTGGRGLSVSDLVVQSYGRLGQFQGYAYLPSAVPAGVSLSDIH
jgi:hypothetical protein